MTPYAAISEGGILAPYFKGPSWDLWKAVQAAAYGEPLTEAQHALFVAVTERDPPTRPVREQWHVVGRRGGKDSIASACAVVAAIGDYSAQLRPGERATVLCLASSRDQAKLVFRYIKGYFNGVALLRPLIVRETEEALELANGVEIVVSTNSFRAVRGRSIVCCILDEVAFYRSDESANPDNEVYAAIMPAMATFDAPTIIGISSAHRRSGLLFDKWREFYGKDDPDVLVVKGTSLQFNPTLDPRFIEKQIERDPDRYSAEYLSIWRPDLSDYVSRAAVEAVVIPGRREIPRISGVRYIAFCDPSGGSSDSYCLAIAHREKATVVLDCLRQRKPPFSPESVTAEFADTLKSYGVTRVTGDRYGGEFPRELFRKSGITYDLSDRPASDIYRDVLPLINSGLVELLDIPLLINQICALERRIARSGKDNISHPVGGHDDAANAVCGALLLVGSAKQPMRISLEALEWASRPGPRSRPTAFFLR